MSFKYIVLSCMTVYALFLFLAMVAILWAKGNYFSNFGQGTYMYEEYFCENI